MIFGLVAGVCVAGCPLAGAQDYCPRVAPRASDDKAWNRAISDRRIAVETSPDKLKASKLKLDNAISEEYGKPGSAKTLSRLFVVVAAETADTLLFLANYQEKPIKIVSALNPEKVVSAVELVREHTEDKIEDLTTPLKDRLRDLVPALRVARKLDDIIKAQSDYTKAVTRIEKEIKALDRKLRELGGPERKYAVDELLEVAKGERQSCETSTTLNTPKQRSHPAQKAAPAERNEQDGSSQAATDSAAILGAFTQILGGYIASQNAARNAQPSGGSTYGGGTYTGSTYNGGPLTTPSRGGPSTCNGYVCR